MADNRVGTKPLASTRPLTAPFPEPAPQSKGFFGEAFGFVKDVFVGGGEAVVDMAKGVGQMIMHPIQTAKGIAFLATTLVTNPKEGASMLGHAFIDPYMEAVKSGHPGKALGRGIVEIGSLFVGPADVVNGVKGAVAFGKGTVNAAKAGAGVAQAAKTGYYAGKWTLEASKAAVKAEKLAHLGHAAEAAKMAQVANTTLRAAQAAKLGQLGKVSHYATLFSKIYTVNVGGVMMKSAQLAARGDALISAGRFSWIAGNGTQLTAKAAEDASRASLVAKAVIAGKSLEPGLVAGFLKGKVAIDGVRAAEILEAAGVAGKTASTAVRAGEVVATESRWSKLASAAAKFAMDNPAVLFPISPVAAVALDALGRLRSIPKDVDPRGITPDEGTALALKYGLSPDPVNVQQFLVEIGSYDGNAIGPDTGSADQVKQLQTLLRALGYQVEKTGIWDESTAHSVIDFKTKNGIYQSYKRLDGSPAVNEYATPNVIDGLINKLEG